MKPPFGNEAKGESLRWDHHACWIFLNEGASEPMILPSDAKSENSHHYKPAKLRKIRTATNGTTPPRTFSNFDPLEVSNWDNRGAVMHEQDSVVPSYTTGEHQEPAQLSVKGFPLEELLRDRHWSLGLSAPKRRASEYVTRLRGHISGDQPSRRLARTLGRWRKFPFTLAENGVPCEPGLAALALCVRQIFDAIDEDDQDRAEQPVREQQTETVPETPAPRPKRCQKAGWLTIRDVAEMLDCSYSQARERMLDGRLKAIKDRKHIRSRKEWVDEYLERQLVPEPEYQPEVKLTHRRRPKKSSVKPQGIGLRFLKKRED